MRINKMGLNYTHNQNFEIKRPKGSGDYLLLFMKAPAIFELKGKLITAEKNSVILFRKGTPQIYRAGEHNYANDFIHFDVDSDREPRNIPFDTLFVIPSMKQTGKILKDIYLEFISNNANREESIDLLLQLLFTKINELLQYKPQRSTAYSYYDTLLQLRSLIYRHPEEKWTIERLSLEANLSSSYFQRLYRTTFDVSCMNDVILSKIEYAKNHLSETNCTIHEIAIRCGYANVEHFMRQFKKWVGVTPGKYRIQIRT